MVNGNTENPAWKMVIEHSLVMSVVVYVLVSTPVFFWLSGSMGDVGTVHASITIAGLALGAVLFVPAIKNVIDAQRTHLIDETGMTGGQ